MARKSLSLLPHLLLIAAVASAAATSTQADNNAKPGCPSACGAVSIPYPFGMGDGCFLDESFYITCNNSIPYLGKGNIDVVSINLTDGLLVVNNYIGFDCYEKDGGTTYNSTYRNHPSIDITVLPNLKFSDSRNKFIAVGCDTYGGIMVMEDGSEFWTGCTLFCNTSRDVPDDGTCSGIGCCSAPIPKDLRSFEIYLTSFYNHTECWDFNPCGFGFVTDEGHFKFNRSTLTELRNVSNMPVTLDWAIMGQNCEEAQGNKSTAYACVSPNSDCLNSTNGPRYLCICNKGFEGNPYLPDGCKDINECDTNPDESFCARKCKNLPGSYSCSCPWYMYGDGKTDGGGCKSIFKIIYVVLAVGFGFFAAISIISWVYYAIKKKRMMELKEEFFRQNGGLLLREEQNSLGSGRPSATKLFSRSSRPPQTTTSPAE